MKKRFDTVFQRRNFSTNVFHLDKKERVLILMDLKTVGIFS